MAALLKSQAALKVYVVGHTDNSGTLAHNIALSQQRAAAVVKALTTRYGIPAARLTAKGAASYAPVAVIKIVPARPGIGGWNWLSNDTGRTGQLLHGFAQTGSRTFILQVPHTEKPAQPPPK